MFHIYILPEKRQERQSYHAKVLKLSIFLWRDVISREWTVTLICDTIRIRILGKLYWRSVVSNLHLRPHFQPLKCKLRGQLQTILSATVYHLDYKL